MMVGSCRRIPHERKGSVMKTGKILFVDDDALYLQLLRNIVSLTGVAACYASSGEQAVGLLKEGGISILVTDLTMPGMNGLELARLAKELCPGIDVVMITGDISLELPVLAARVGISKVIAKPCGADQIMAIAEKTVRHQGEAMNA